MYDCHNLAWIDLSHNYLVNLAYVNQLKKKKILYFSITNIEFQRISIFKNVLLALQLY